MIAIKFGGSSLASASQFKKVKEIVLENAERRAVIPSAPGKRFSDDEKVTDMLYQCFDKRNDSLELKYSLDKVKMRYKEIKEGLGLNLDLDKLFADIFSEMYQNDNDSFFASRGEMINGLLLSEYLDFRFIDAADVICFDENNKLDLELSCQKIKEAVKENEKVVIPGFYGKNINGEIVTFSRGGSDITGSIVARALKARVYENFTDVSGFLMADPRIVNSPSPISHITYEEMYSLSKAGANVLHKDSVMPVESAGIPINIRNTNFKDHPGTLITKDAKKRAEFSIFAGLSGKSGFCLLTFECLERTKEKDFQKRLIKIFKNRPLEMQILPINQSITCFLVDIKQISYYLDIMLEELNEEEIEYNLTNEEGFALIVLAGYKIIHSKKIINDVYSCLKNKNIDLVLINQTVDELTTSVVVYEEFLNEAIAALYDEFSNI